MIDIETIFIEVQGLQPADLERWIGAELVRPEGPGPAYRFHDIDVARLRLILELRDVLDINEPALPTVLSLLDQLYQLRRQLRHLNAAMENSLPAAMRAALLQAM